MLGRTFSAMTGCGPLPMTPLQACWAGSILFTRRTFSWKSRPAASESERCASTTGRSSFGTGPAGAVIIDSKEFDLAIDKLPVKGALRLEAPLILPGTAPPAALTGNLEIDRVDLGSLFKPSPAGGSVPPSEDPLPVHTCLAWDVGLELALGAVQLGGAAVTGVRFDVKSSGGDWKLRLLDAQFPAGEGEAEVSLRCGRLPVEFDLRSRVRSKGKSHFGQSGATVEVLGRMESILVLRGQGSTWKEVVGDLAGRFAVFLGPVQTGALADSFYARGLFHALTVSWRQSQKAVVDCAIIDMHIEKGVARTHQIVIATPTLVIDGHGQVELAEDRVDIALIPRPKHPRLGTLHVPVRVSGSIEKPHVGLDWEDVLPRIGMETATAIVEPLFSLRRSDRRRVGGLSPFARAAQDGSARERLTRARQRGGFAARFWRARNASEGWSCSAAADGNGPILRGSGRLTPL